jgi:acyl-CoA synthetase (NDP forming)
MDVFTERKSGDFLKKFGFNVVKSIYIEDKNLIRDSLEKIGLPCVVKVFGENIVHKKKLGGVALGVKSYEEVLEIYENFKKIHGAEGIVIQEEIKSAPKGVPRNIFQKKMFTKGNEFLIGLQKTADFGHVVAFGVGGSDVEKLKKVDFRVCPFEKQDALELINENFGNLSTENKKILVEVLFKCCKLAKKFPTIKELDINPLVISKGKGIILDSRIVF